MSPASATSTLAYLGLAALAYRGAGMTPRAEGHGEQPCVEAPARDDKAWAFRGPGADVRELTRVPVRSTGQAGEDLGLDGGQTPTRVDCVVVGGAAGGLATAACLQRRGVRNVLVLEKNEQSGDIWRSRYHRLHLHDIAEECSLPGFAVPDHFPVYISRADYATYLDSYARVLGINIKRGMLVKHAKKDAKRGEWEVTVENLAPGPAFGKTYTVTCTHLILCNGIYNDPFIPDVPNAFKGLQLHSARYTNGTELQLKDKRVLVVGFGNSACEIAVDLVEHGARPLLLARSPQTVVPRSMVRTLESLLYTHITPLMSIPFGWVVVLLGVLCIDPYVYYVQQTKWGGREGLKKLGIPLDRKGIVLRAVLNNEPPVQDVGTIALAQQNKLQVKTGEVVNIAEDGTVTFTDKSTERVDAIVWATGYKMLQGHQHIFDEDVVRLMGGTGVEAVKENMILPGSEHPKVPHLWLNFGRIQMLRDGAASLSWKVAAQLGASSPENDAVDRKESWAMFAAKHAAVIVAYKAMHKWSNGSAASAKAGGSSKL